LFAAGIMPVWHVSAGTLRVALFRPGRGRRSGIETRLKVAIETGLNFPETTGTTIGHAAPRNRGFGAGLIGQIEG